MAILPENSVSIIDELKKRGFTPQAGERLPFFGLRQNLFEQSGLKGALGEFSGTATQNLKLLEDIQRKNITPQSLGIAPVVPVAPIAPTGTTATATLTTAGLPQPQRLPTADELGIPKRTTEADILSRIPQQRGTTAEDVLATARGGLEAGIAQRRGVETLAAGEAAAAGKAEQFGARGLFFSGARVSAEGAARATALSKKMSIDEGLARFIIQQQEQGDKETANRIKDIVNDAVRGNEKDRSEAITALSGLGYVVMPNGQIVQKPSEARAGEAAIRAEEAGIRAEGREERAIRGEQRAIEAAERSEIRFQEFIKATRAGLKSTAFNIRAGVSDLTEAQVDDLAASPTPPIWFKSREESKSGASLTSGEIGRRWLDAQAKLVKAAETSSIEDTIDAAINKALQGVK